MLGAFVHIFLDSLQKEKASCVEISWAPLNNSQEQPLKLLLSFLVEVEPCLVDQPQRKAEIRQVEC